MDAQLASMGTTDKFLGVAYVYIQMVFDAEKFGGGMPAISFKVKGINISHTMTHLKKFKVSGGTSNKVANLPIIKFPDQNKAAKVRKE